MLPPPRPTGGGGHVRRPGFGKEGGIALRTPPSLPPTHNGRLNGVKSTAFDVVYVGKVPVNMRHAQDATTRLEVRTDEPGKTCGGTARNPDAASGLTLLDVRWRAVDDAPGVVQPLEFVCLHAFMLMLTSPDSVIRLAIVARPRVL